MVVVSWYKHAAQCPSVIAPYVLDRPFSAILYKSEMLGFAGSAPTYSPTYRVAGFSGSLVVAEFASLIEAQAWADTDPFTLTGVYEKVTVKPFKKVLP